MRRGQVLRVFMSLSLGHVLAKGIGFLGLVWLARLVDGTELGRFATVITIVGYMTAISNWGSDAVAIRHVARFPETGGDVGRIVTRSRLIVGAICYVGFSCVAVGLGGLGWAIGPVGVATLAYAYRRDWSLLARGKGKWIALSQTIREVLFAGLVLGLVAQGPSAGAALWAVAIADAGWTVATLLFSGDPGKRSAKGSVLGVNWLFREGWPIAIVSIMTMTYNKIDVPILAMFRPADEVGAYWAAYTILFGVMGLAALFTRAALPEMSRLASIGKTGGLSSSFHLALIACVAGSVLSITLGVRAEQIVVALYGPGLRQSGEYLRILAAILPAYFLGSVLIGRLVAEGSQRRWAIAAILAAAANVVLNLFLIPRIGAKGAAFATIASEWSMAGIVLWSYREHEHREALYLSVFWIVFTFALTLLALNALSGHPSLSLMLPIVPLLCGLPIALQRVPRLLSLRPVIHPSPLG